MFSRCFKNYLISFKYIFSILGVLFLALLIGGHVLVSGTRGALNDMTTQISQTTGDADLSTERIWSAIKGNLSEELNPGDDKMISGDEAQNAVVQSVSDAVSETTDNYVNYIAEISKIVSAAIAKFLGLLVFFVIIQIVGIILSRSAILIFARESIARRNVFIMMNTRLLYDIIIGLALVLLCWVFSKLPAAGIALSIIYPILFCILSLWTANLSLGKKNRASMSTVLRAGNVVVLVLTNILELIIAVGIGFCIFYIGSPLAAIYVNLALVVVASVSVTLNADSIVSHCASHKRALDKKERADSLEVVDIDESLDETTLEESTDEQ